MRNFFSQARQARLLLALRPAVKHYSIKEKEELLKSLYAKREKMQQETSNLTPSWQAKEAVLKNLKSNLETIKAENSVLQEKIPSWQAKQALLGNLKSKLETIKSDNSVLTQTIAENDIAKAKISMAPQVLHKVLAPPLPTISFFQAPNYYPQQPAPPQTTTIFVNEQRRSEPVVYQSVSPPASPPPPPPPSSSMPEIQIVDDDPSPWDAIVVGCVVVLVIAGCFYCGMHGHKDQAKKEVDETGRYQTLYETRRERDQKLDDARRERELDEEIERVQKEIAAEEAKQQALIKRLKNN